jgi:O-methyltransferase involved in polyketide biosynthesis
MNSDEPSRMALMVARQRAAHQMLDHGAILYDPYAVRILGEHEDHVLQTFNGHPMMSMGRLFTAARSRIAEDALARAVERGVAARSKPEPTCPVTAFLSAVIGEYCRSPFPGTCPT